MDLNYFLADFISIYEVWQAHTKNILSFKQLYKYLQNFQKILN